MDWWRAYFYPPRVAVAASGRESRYPMEGSSSDDDSECEIVSDRKDRKRRDESHDDELSEDSDSTVSSRTLYRYSPPKPLPSCPWKDVNGEIKDTWYAPSGVEMEVETPVKLGCLSWANLSECLSCKSTSWICSQPSLICNRSCMIWKPCFQKSVQTWVCQTPRRPVDVITKYQNTSHLFPVHSCNEGQSFVMNILGEDDLPFHCCQSTWQQWEGFPLLTQTHLLNQVACKCC
jgi:hypothetical protein